MTTIIGITLKGIFRDRIFQGIMVTALMFLLIPSVASLSMRQVTELSITLSLSLISFILLLLSIFLGGTTLWKDIDRRYTFSVLSLPISRSAYLMGRFLGVALFLMLAAVFLGAVSFAMIRLVTGMYPPARPVIWSTIFLSVVLDACKYILLVAVAMLFSSFSTSFFLPVFGTIAVFLAGSTTQQVYDYLHSPSAQQLGQTAVWAGNLVYYLLPNFSAFDLKVNAIYALPLSSWGILLTLAYCSIYVTVLLGGSALVLGRREMK
jgi:ABC-type transport system involved in multi-copper enzyme maturation permease subunit